MQPPPNQIYSSLKEQTYQIYRKAHSAKFKEVPDFSPLVICSFSLLKQPENSVTVVSVGFGTKSLPESLSCQFKGRVIKDMHAEILARRGLIKYLSQKLPQPSQQTQIFAWDKEKAKHKLRQQYKLLMFVNEVFCGDCMVDQSENIFSGARPLKYFNLKQVPQEKYSQYCLRTKPGRFDLPLDKRTLSLSCSDKVGTWNILGVQGKVLFNYMRPVYISTIIMETSRKVNRRRIMEGIDLRFRILQSSPSQGSKVDAKLFKIVVGGRTRYITSQFHCHKPEIVVLKADIPSKEEESKKRMDLCGIISCNLVSWINGRTGLPEGVNINKMNKLSPFCTHNLYAKLKSNQEEEFKYKAVKERIKLLFGEWTDDYRKKE